MDIDQRAVIGSHVNEAKMTCARHPVGASTMTWVARILTPSMVAAMNVPMLRAPAGVSPIAIAGASSITAVHSGISSIVAGSPGSRRRVQPVLCHINTRR